MGKPLADLIIVGAWPVDPSTGTVAAGAPMSPAEFVAFLAAHPYAPTP